MKTRSLILIFLLCLGVFLVAKAPLGLALRFLPADSRISYGRAEGTVWRGTVHNLVVNGAALGDLALDVSPLSLFSLRPQVDWELAGGAVAGRGAATLHPGQRALTLRDSTLDARLARLPTMMTLDGGLSATIRTLTLGPAGCLGGEAALATDMLTRNPAGMDWQGPPMTGTVTCRDGGMVMVLGGADAANDIDIEARVDPDLRYRLRVSAETDNADLARALPLLGFSGADGDFDLVREGLLTAPPAASRRDAR